MAQEHAVIFCSSSHRASPAACALSVLEQLHLPYLKGQERTEQILLCFRYVSKKVVDTNVVYVSREYYKEDKQRNAFQCSGFNWISSDRPRQGTPLFCKVRHGPSMYRCASGPEGSSCRS